jgi:hypothetical protein
MSKLGGSIAAVVLSVALAAAALAHGGGGHGGGGHGGGAHHGGGFHHGFHRHGFVGGFGGVGDFYDPWWYYGYPYVGYPYPAVVVPGAPPQNLWYFCQPANAYYPYVSSCPVPWQPVPAQE